MENNNEMRHILPNIKIYYYSIENGMVPDTRIDRTVKKCRNLKLPVCVCACVEIIISNTSVSDVTRKMD